MPGPLAHRGGRAGPPRPPPLPHRPTGAAVLRRLASAPPAVDHAAALPPDVVRVLRLIAAELRSMPRDCARDREELVFWHARLARRLDAVVASKARAPASAKPGTPPAAGVEAAPPPAAAARKRVPAAHQVAREGPRPLPARSAPAKRWRARPVDAAFRRGAEAAGQLGLSL